MTKLHTLSLLIIAFLLTSCTYTVKSLKEDNQIIQNLENHKGYLLIGVETEHNLKQITIDGPENIRLSHADLKKGSNFILIPLSAGDYQIDSVTYNYWVESRMSDEEVWSFTVKPQTISYVGHLEIKEQPFFQLFIQLELVNRSTEALDFMELKFPSLLNERELFYGGPGEDDYFQFIKGLDK